MCKTKNCLLLMLVLTIIGCKTIQQVKPDYRPNEFINYYPTTIVGYPDYDCSYWGSSNQLRFDFVNTNGIADKAGIKSGDIIKEVNGFPIKGAPDYFNTVIPFWNRVDAINMKIERNGKNRLVKIIPKISYVDPVYYEMIKLNICAEEELPVLMLMQYCTDDKRVYITSDSRNSIPQYVFETAARIAQSIPLYYYAGSAIKFISHDNVEAIIEAKQKQLSNNIYLDTKMFSIMQAKYIFLVELIQTDAENIHFVYTLLDINNGEILAKTILKKNSL